MNDRFRLNQTVWCYYDSVIPVVEGKIISERKTTERMGKLIGYYEVHWKNGGTSGFLEEDIYAKKKYLYERIDKEYQKEIDEKEKREYEEYLRLKKKFE